MLAAAQVPVESLPAHRIALRAAICGVAGALACAVVALPLVLLSGDDHPGLLMLLAPGSGAAMSAFFVLTVELARRLPTRGRLAAVLALGAISPGFVMCALIWAYHLVRGATPEHAWQEIMRFLSDVASHADASLPAVAAVLLPFAAAGAAHAGGVPGLLGRVPTLPARVVLAVVTGAVGCLIAWLRFEPWGSERVLFAGFALVPPALELSIALALRVEARLLEWWAKRREQA